jgi:hypothetical protein
MKRSDIVEYWHKRYGYNRDMIRVAMGITEATSQVSYENKQYRWRLQGSEEEAIQSICRILQRMGPSDPREYIDFRRLWEQESKQEIISSLMAWHEPGTFVEADLQQMTQQELTQLAAYRLMREPA